MDANLVAALPEGMPANDMTDMPRSTLYLLRHAHSSWASPGQRDHQRPLDARGRGDALALGPELLRMGAAIEAVVCSTAVRAMETFAAVRPYLGPAIPVAFSDSLYAQGVEAYREALHGHGDAGSLLLIGHNPMIEEFTLSLSGSSEAAARKTLEQGFPTAGLAVLAFATTLSEVVAGGGHLRHLLHPRDHRR